MTATLLVTIEIDDPSTLPALADEIFDDLAGGGHDIISVEPWARPSTFSDGLSRP